MFELMDMIDRLPNQIRFNVYAGLAWVISLSIATLVGVPQENVANAVVVFLVMLVVGNVAVYFFYKKETEGK